MLLPAVVSLLNQQTPAPIVCEKLGICSSNPLVPYQPDFQVIPQFTFDLDQPMANRCTFCQLK